MNRKEKLRLNLDVLAAVVEDLPEWFSARYVINGLANSKKSIPAPFNPHYSIDKLKLMLSAGARSGFLEAKRVYLSGSKSRNRIMFYRFKRFKDVVNMKIHRTATKKDIAAIRTAGKGTLWVPIESVILSNQRLTLHCRVKRATPPEALPPSDVPEYVKAANIAYVRLEYVPYAAYEGGDYKLLEEGGL